ncbi:hypothetical protein [Dokdonella sp.]|uniref:hypothetical protein n=1 Tax=Dokdonella sp. TaxID=2291710 RepID=UPI001B01AA62|nr:hypothetical protein [Dokdonella sp.]MBO9663308.1 hypothetical protein [Dokdonella sp.]
MIRLVAAVGILAAGSSAAVRAGQAEICYGPEEQISECASGTCPLPTNDTVFACPTAGNKTLPQLAAAGWTITQLVQRTYSTTPTPYGRQKEQIVIQKP